MVAKLVNKKSGNIIEISGNKNISLGRGSATGCLDKRISRQHATISHFCDDAISIYVLNTNPCFTMEKGEPPIRILKKNDTATLRNGDVLSLLPDFQTCAFKVVIESINHVNEKPNTNVKIKTEISDNGESASHRAVTPELVIAPNNLSEVDTTNKEAADLDVTNYHDESPGSPSLLPPISNFDIDNFPSDTELRGTQRTSLFMKNINHSSDNTSETGAKDPDASIEEEPNSPSLIPDSSSNFFHEMECDPPLLSAVSSNSPTDVAHASGSRCEQEEATPEVRPPTPVTPDLCQDPVSAAQGDELPNRTSVNTTEAVNARDDVQCSPAGTPVKIKPEPVELPTSEDALPSGTNTLSAVKGRRLSDDTGGSSASPAKRPALSDQSTSANDQVSGNDVTYNDGNSSNAAAACVTSDASNVVVKPDPDPGPTSATNRPLCRYANSCYRRNAQHKSQFSHPGDPDWVPEHLKPLCAFDPNCYRRCPDHRINMRHTCDRRPYPDNRTPSQSPDYGGSGDDVGNDEDDELQDSQSTFTSSADFSESGSNYSDQSDGNDVSDPEE